MAPVVFNETTLTRAWAAVVQYLLTSGREAFNVVVHVANPATLDNRVVRAYDRMCEAHGLLSTRHVAYTIFPQSLYEKFGPAPERLFGVYNRPGGVYERLGKRKKSWGTYFRRMTHWPEMEVQPGDVAPTYVNQLDRVLHSLSGRERMFKSAYVVSVWSPAADGRRVRGAPCLLSIALQLERRGEEPVMDILALYRNHNFVDRALGNYVGLVHLHQFLCDHTPYVMGTMSCISSHATIAMNAPSGATWPAQWELEEVLNLALVTEPIPGA